MKKQKNSQLRIGDQVRIMRLPPEWSRDGYYVPADTRRVYRILINRSRAVRINEVDEYGLPWISLRLRGRKGRIEHHHLVIDPGCWVAVKPRKIRPTP